MASGPRWWELDDPERALAAYRAQGNTIYNRTKTRLLERLLGDDLAGRTVLDYGGGGGHMSLRCAQKGARVVLVEPEARALRLAHYQIHRASLGDRVTCVQADGVPGGAELPHRRFDVVLVKDVLEHVPDDRRLLADLAALQDEGGRLLLSTPNRVSLNFLLEGAYHRWYRGNRAWLGWDASHVRMHTPWSLRRVLVDAGYVPRRWWGLYIIPYDILSWPLLLRRRPVLPGLSLVDLWVGGWFPLNRCGWNLVVEARRQGTRART